MQNITKLMEHNENSAKKKTQNTKCLHQEFGEIHTSSLTAHLKALEQKETNTPKRSRCQEITKLSAEINKIET